MYCLSLDVRKELGADLIGDMMYKKSDQVVSLVNAKVCHGRSQILLHM